MGYRSAAVAAESRLLSNTHRGQDQEARPFAGIPEPYQFPSRGNAAGSVVHSIP